ncbi:MAG TPA: hypothetical protein VM682_07375 [Bacillus sp. (in: firmicutes)]|jgi:hypothetical protein|nr:hypothetical protein [Bacillus sp. (in: firmicutes)]
MTISPDLGENVPITVVVKSARGGNVASKLNGVFLLRGREFRFKALAFGRIGGHNISLTIPKIALNEIIKMGLDPDVIYLKIQRKLIEGEVDLEAKPPGAGRASL